MSKEILIEAKDVKKIYINGEDRVEALRGASVIIRKGDAISIFGPSGSGKSTLLHILGGLDRPTVGQVFFEEQDLFSLTDDNLAEFRNRMVGFVFQFHHLLPEFSVQENVALPLLVGGVGKKAAFDRAAEMLEAVGLTARADFLPVKISGGERQRAAVARALVHKPKLILADEPTGNLDSETEKNLMDIFADLNRRLEVTQVIVSHNPLIKTYTHRHYDLVDGKM